MVVRSFTLPWICTIEDEGAIAIVHVQAQSRMINLNLLIYQ